MDFNVNVRFDATPALVDAVSALLTAFGGRSVTPQVPITQISEPEKRAETISNALVTQKTESLQSEATSIRNSDVEKKEISQIDVRDAMERKRIEFGCGMDLAVTNEISVMRNKLKKAFKQIAGTLMGKAEGKPSDLPENLRAEFIERVGHLRLMDNGDVELDPF